tara:strand:+ start:94 stop:480 length:387 start_codon:yes stop_codon:yes gene_type:complete
MKAFDKLPMKKKIQQIVKELLTASKMHKNQADKLKSVVDEMFGSKPSSKTGKHKNKMGKSQELEMNKTDRMTLFDAVQVAKAMDANGGADAPSKMSPKYDGDDMKADKKKKKKKKKMRNWKVPGEVPA